MIGRAWLRQLLKLVASSTRLKLLASSAVEMPTKYDVRREQIPIMRRCQGSFVIKELICPTFSIVAATVRSTWTGRRNDKMGTLLANVNFPRVHERQMAAQAIVNHHAFSQPKYTRMGPREHGGH